MEAMILAQSQDVLLRGIMGFSIAVVILIGSVWLLLAMIIGARMGYLVMASVFFAIMIILSFIWVVTAFGPVGPETTWFAVGIGGDLTEVARHEDTFDVSDYPRGDWEVPAEEALAALGEEDEADVDPVIQEARLAKPVLETAVSKAVDPESAPAVEGEDPTEELRIEAQVELEPGSFTVIEIGIRDATVDGKESLISMARAVPSERVLASSLGEGVEEGTVVRYLVEVGDEIAAGDPILVAATEQGEVQVTSDIAGRVIGLGLRTPEQTGGEGDRVREGAPIAVADLTGRPGAPDPVEVAAVRVLGSVRTPSVVYLIVSVVLFALHLALLSRAEKARKGLRQPATEAA